MNPTLLSPEGLSGLVFLGLVAVTICGAVIATAAKRLIRCLTGLVACFMGVAGLYYYLGSPFVAMMQLLIYVGAIAIVIAFGIMLAEPDEAKLVKKKSGLSGVLSLIAGSAVAWGLAVAALRADWMSPAVKLNDGSVRDVGMSLLTTYSMVFELVSVVLLVAILGSLALARTGRDKE
jgi:NADH-quinone oxidoreductase subunit J